MKLHLVTLAVSASACLLPSDLVPRDAREGNHFALHARQTRPEPDFPIGKGDRFSNGAVVPQGLSTSDRDLKSILTPTEVSSALQGLANTFSEVELIRPPFKSFEGFQFLGAQVGQNPKLLVISGVHARERGGPDNVVYFLSDLLHARKANKGLKYGQTTFTAAQVQKALDAGIVVLPLVNPDGVKYDQATNQCWRKNRNPKSSNGSGARVGIDINRNYDFLWDYKKAFSPNADLSAASSDSPSSEVFHGTSPASEPETKSVVWAMDKYKNLTWFIDLHSFGGAILYSWGDDNTQSQSPDQNFANPTYDGRRGVTGNEPARTAYKEYMTSQDYSEQKSVANRMKAAMEKAGSTLYTVMESVGLYPTAGASTDYALSRFYGAKCGAGKLQSYTVEFGEESGSALCPFYPGKTQYHMWMKQVASGLMEVALQAADSTPQVSTC